MVDSESDADDERLPVGAVPEVALESDLCSESSVIVGDAEVFALTDDAASVHGRTSAIPSGSPTGVQGPGSIRVSNAAHAHSVDREEVNTPSSDTETVGGVSDVFTVVLEPEVLVDDIVSRARQFVGRMRWTSVRFFRAVLQ